LKTIPGNAFEVVRSAAPIHRCWSSRLLIGPALLLYGSRTRGVAEHDL